MARPIQFTTPLPTTLLTGFGGAVDTNLLPTQPFQGNYSPFVEGSALNTTLADSPSLVPSASSVIVGNSTNNKVVLNRNLIVYSTADLSAETINLTGRDTTGKLVTTGDIAGPAALGTITTTTQFAILDSFSCSLATAADNFNLTIGLTLTTSPIRIDTFYPNSSIGLGAKVGGTAGTWRPFTTAQRITLYDISGKPYLNPDLVWTAANAAVATDLTVSTVSVKGGVYFTGTLADTTSYFVFFVTQQGVR
jgi:hypothetical protein